MNPNAPHPPHSPSDATPNTLGSIPGANRRTFLKTTAFSALAGASIPKVFAGEDNTLQVALVGCGGRGTGAAAQALHVSATPTKLVAMADVFPEKMAQSYNALSSEFAGKPEKLDVPQDRQFIGFDSYKNALDCLKPGDIAIFATPLAFRWVHFQYAIDKGLHVFMEKPLTADGPTSRRMLELSKKADEKNLKVGVGLMVRHCRGRQELKKRIDDGQIGDIILMRAYRMHGPVASCFSKKKPDDQSEVMYQIDRFHSFLWASGGSFSDFNIHQIDECSWMKGSWPTKAQALGGRHYRGDWVDQNFDTYTVEYTYDDGSKFYFEGRTMEGCYNNMSSTVHGSKGSAIVSASGHTPGKVRIFNGQKQDRRDVAWAFPQPEPNPYQLEWDDLVEAIVKDLPYNEVPRGVQASLVTSMGRMAAHTGQEITYDQMLNHEVEFAPDVANMTPDGPAPIVADASGRYPVPEPGIKTDREY
ncbi:Gfo/Idh/MocA family oxidoreductase [soil metagenome]